MATALDNLVAAKQLKAEASTPGEVDALLRRAAGLLTDAGNAALSPVSRFALAYDAAFALATACLRIAGYRADAARGHRAVVFQVLPHTLQAPQALWTALSVAHDRRNAVEYSSALAPTDSEVRDLLLLARSLDGLVKGRVSRTKQ